MWLHCRHFVMCLPCSPLRVKRMHARASSEEMRADSRAASIRAPASAGTADLTEGERKISGKGGGAEWEGEEEDEMISEG